MEPTDKETPGPLEPKNQPMENSGFRGYKVNQELRDRVNASTFARECAMASTVTDALTREVQHDLLLGVGRQIDFAQRYYEDAPRSEAELLEFANAFRRIYLGERLGLPKEEWLQEVEGTISGA